MILDKRLNLIPPPEVVATWPTPNRVNPETRGPALYYLSIILASLGVLVVSARIYSRILITRAPGIDDVIIVYALAAALALTVLVIMSNTKFHSGYHVWDIDFSLAKDHRLNIWIGQWMYLTSTGAIKISVLLFYRRLSVSFTKAFRWATWAGIIYNVIQLIAFGLALLLACRPVYAYWMSFDITWLIENRGRFQCGNEGVGLTTSAVFSVVGDLYAALLPSLLVSRLQLPRRQKFAVAGLFAVAYLVVGMGIGRAVFIYRTTLVSYDYTWELYELWIWALLETWVGIYAASAPALKPFCKRFLVDPIASVGGSGTNGSNAKRNTIGSGEPKPKPRSWNCLSSSGTQSPTRNADETRILKSESSPVSNDHDPKDLEPRSNSLVMQPWSTEQGLSIDDRVIGDSEAYRWSPATPPPRPLRASPSRSGSQSISETKSPATSFGSQKHYRAVSAASRHHRIHSSERHISAQIRSLDVTNLNATPSSRAPSRAHSQASCEDVSSRPAKQRLHTSRSTEDAVGLAISTEIPASRPGPLSPKNAFGRESPSRRRRAPSPQVAVSTQDRIIRWSVLNEEADEESRYASSRARPDSTSRLTSIDSIGKDNLTLPMMMMPPPPPVVR